MWSVWGGWGGIDEIDMDDNSHSDTDAILEIHTWYAIHIHVSIFKDYFTLKITIFNVIYLCISLKLYAI